ncbi:hypothetical protein ZIOFF_050622 [Zingiber officinale]|uniref:Acyl-CoA oxidase C-terminal domain-containing protein n=1 Tax=Zingiber officinale TaxID=94328 RepID=A0A8J5FLF8_ZINOF|nr:hypothetical protein ZIOFF_050622 [Zingiber officinale]
MKTISQLGTGKQPVGTTAYMGRIQHLMQSKCDVLTVKDGSVAMDVSLAFKCSFNKLQSLSSCAAEDWLKPSVILEAFEARAIRMAVKCAKDISQFPSQEDGFHELSADLMEAAIAHCQLIIVSKEKQISTVYNLIPLLRRQNSSSLTKLLMILSTYIKQHNKVPSFHVTMLRFIDKVQEDIQGRGVKEVLQILCSVYALSLVHKHLGDFITTGYITPKQGALANEKLRSQYSQVCINFPPNSMVFVSYLKLLGGFIEMDQWPLQLRLNAVALVDAFNYTDHYLGSILGRFDGNVYPNLYEAAWNDPLNDSVVPDGYHEYIKPLIQQKLAASRL